MADNIWKKLIKLAYGDGLIRDKLLSYKAKTVCLDSAEAGAASFSPLSLTVLMPGEQITFNLFLKVLADGGRHCEFLPFLKEGETWENQWQEHLEAKGIDRLYFHNNDLEDVIAFLNNYLQLLNCDNKRVSRKLLKVFAEHLNFSLRRVIESPRLGPAVKLAKRQVEELTKWLHQDPAAIKVMSKILYHDYSLYNHSINVCLLGVAFLVFSRYSATESRDLGLACLFHDIGMTKIPHAIIFKKEPLTDAEMAEIRTHPERGYRILIKGLNASRADLPKEVLRLTLEHHENADGSGYPRGLPLSRQHPWTPIIRLLDSYDSLTVNRPYREAFKPFDSLKILKESHGSRGQIYDSQILKNFIIFLTVE